MRKQLESAGERPDVIILDPPRKGCDDATLTACAGMQPERIVMISCNAATAARDCKRLEELGYALKKCARSTFFRGRATLSVPRF